MHRFRLFPISAAALLAVIGGVMQIGPSGGTAGALALETSGTGPWINHHIPVCWENPAAGSANDSLPISVAGVLDDKSGLPVVLEPGTYTLDMVLATYAGSCGSEVEFLAPHLTYVLLGAGA